MATYSAHVVMEYVDINGDTATVRMPFQASDAGTVGALHTLASNTQAVVDACTNAKNISLGVTVLLNKAHLIVGTTPPNNAEYSSVTDGARLQFGNSLGERTSVTIPAPLESDFGSSSNVVDSTDANVSALIAFWQANADNPNNSLFNLYQGGIKVGHRARRRRSSLVP